MYSEVESLPSPTPQFRSRSYTTKSSRVKNTIGYQLHYSNSEERLGETSTLDGRNKVK